MALSKNMKTRIVAAWKTGEFETYAALAKHYKIDPKTAKKLCDGIPKENAAIVEVLTAGEMAKKSVGNPSEIHAIDKAVERRMRVEEQNMRIIDRNRELAIKAQDKIAEAFDEGYIGITMVKDITAALKNLENIANPKPSTQITNVNANVSTLKEQARKIQEATSPEEAKRAYLEIIKASKGEL